MKEIPCFQDTFKSCYYVYTLSSLVCICSLKQASAKIALELHRVFRQFFLYTAHTCSLAILLNDMLPGRKRERILITPTEQIQYLLGIEYEISSSSCFNCLFSSE